MERSANLRWPQLIYENWNCVEFLHLWAVVLWAVLKSHFPRFEVNGEKRRVSKKDVFCRKVYWTSWIRYRLTTAYMGKIMWKSGYFPAIRMASCMDILILYVTLWKTPLMMLQKAENQKHKTTGWNQRAESRLQCHRTHRLMWYFN